MKNLKFLLFSLAILAMSCSVGGQIRRTVHGDHNVTSSFTGVKASSGVDVYLSQGDDQSVVVEADANLHEYIRTEVRNDVLHVYTDVNIRDAKEERVYVTMPDIRSVATSSAGDIVGKTPIRTDELSLSASSAGDIDLEVYAKSVELHLSSSGDINIKGETETLKADLSSAGDLSAYDLKSKEADISVSSAGDADIYVTENLRARASSAGDISYRGNPSRVDVHTSSAGGIHSR